LPGRAAGVVGVVAGIVAGGLAALAAAQTPVESVDARSAAADRVVAKVATPNPFIVAPGRRAAIFGYARGGLEVWAWPLQLLADYRIDFLPRGGTTKIEGSALLQHVAVYPDRVVRRYVGADFVVRETLFVPLHAAGASIRYQVSGRGRIDIEVHFTPSLNLIWPAALGGQSTQWNPALGGYVIEEPVHGLQATIASAQIIAHDATPNRTQPIGVGLALTLRPRAVRPGILRASLAISLPAAHSADLIAANRQFLAAAAAARATSGAHYRRLLAHSLRIETPDASVNAALAWATIALDQAWVCNAALGCGEVAGYGPSRAARRAQYAWFFAGDGLTAVDAWVAAGDTARARRELEFIFKYQDQKSGMIWHELAQSANFIDWRRLYPYMFVHVDITFQFLAAVERYVRASGDEPFLRRHWPQIRAAYAYCRSLLDPATRLPRIPAGKEDIDEQNHRTDSLDLSAEWIDASAAFARLAAIVGEPALAAAAQRRNEAARAAVAALYWDPAANFWLAGHSTAGRPISGRWTSGPAGLLGEGVFGAARTQVLLDRLASAGFQTDWGSRGLAADAPTYDPNAYASGSVWAIGTAKLAEAYWRAGRPATAYQIWSSLVGWSRIDAPGHMDEVLAGDLYHPEIESVPAQTWSSAGFLQATVRGLLGLRVAARTRSVTFAPYLPPDWPGLTLRHVAVGGSLLTLALRRQGQTLSLDVTNTGAPLTLHFAPSIPVGARLVDLRAGGRRLRAVTDEAPQDTRVRADLRVGTGSVHCVLRYSGGVSVVPITARPHAGEASRGPRLLAFRLDGRQLRAQVDVRADQRPAAAFDLQTDWRPIAVDGGSIQNIGPNRYRIFVEPRPAAGAKAAEAGYVRAAVGVRFAAGASR